MTAFDSKCVDAGILNFFYIASRLPANTGGNWGASAQTSVDHCNTTSRVRDILTLYVHQSRGVTRTCLLSGLSLVLFSPDAEPKPGEPDSLLLLVIHHRAGPSPAIVQESHFPELARLVDGLVPLLLDGVLGGGEPPPPGQQFAPHERTVSSWMFLSCQSGRTVLLCCCEREGNSFSWTD